MASVPFPECPQHPGSKVVKDGFYGREPHRRQRFRCSPDGGDPHRFTPVVPRVTTRAGECLDCERELASHEGPHAVRRYEFDTRQMATALVQVAGGVSYREATAGIRVEVGRGGRKPHGQLVADWVEVFSGPLWDRFGVSEWPEVIVCDSSKVTRRSTSKSNLSRYPHQRRAQKAMKRRTVYTLLVATSRHRSGWPAVMAQAVPGDASTASREDFFRLLPSRPRAIVADQAASIFKAADAVWPETPTEKAPQPVWCLHHVKETFTFPKWAHTPSNATEAADRRRYRDAFSDCGRSVQDWDAFVTLARQLDGGEFLEEWFAWNGRELQMRTQLATWQPDDPRSNAAAEEAIRWLKRRLGDRPFTNAERTNRLLRLMVLGHRNDDDPRAWSHVIRDHAEQHAGRTGTQHRTIKDPKASRSL